MPTQPASILTESGLTMRSDSETYDGGNELSPSPAASSESSPLILYKPPTVWGLLRGAAINLLLPFINGLMLGFGELVANEAAYRLGWSGTKVRLFVLGIFLACAFGADLISRYSQQPASAAHRRAAWAPASRCAMIPWSGGGEAGRRWTCILRSSRWPSQRERERGGSSLIKDNLIFVVTQRVVQLLLSVCVYVCIEEN